ncbi:unnamed protein product [Owenia fusiformis]|uniref:Uncharacterized protein n=1 Tax=Owenia fusiformis TaxID=6347 RepID=A0A8J1TKC7_OWEFU|nr:unnamed protein product [Owenia fusiformis]
MEEMIYVMIDLVLIVLILLSNGCILCLLVGFKQIRTTTSLVIVSIAAADIIISVVVIPIHLYTKANTSYEIGPRLCKIYMYINYWCRTVSVYVIISIALDAFFIIYYSVHASITQAKSMFFLNLTCFFAAAVNIWVVVNYTTQNVIVNDSLNISSYTLAKHQPSNMTTPNSSGYSVCTFQSENAIGAFFLIMDMIVLFLLPIIALVVLLVLIWRKLETSRLKTSSITRKLKMLKMAVLLVAVFVLTNLPKQSVVLYAWVTDVFNPKLNAITEIISYSGGIWMAVVLFSCYKDLQHGVKKLFNFTSENTRMERTSRSNRRRARERCHTAEMQKLDPNGVVICGSERSGSFQSTYSSCDSRLMIPNPTAYGDKLL